MCTKRLSVVIALLMLVLAPMLNTGQTQDVDSCAALADRAFAELGTNCANLGPNGVCYGFSRVEATFSETVPFSVPGDSAPLTTLETIRTGALSLTRSEWGIALLKVRANTPAASSKAIVYLMLGEVELENAVPPDEALLLADPVDIRATDAVDLRSTPGFNAQVVGRFPAGTPLEADGVTPDGQWVRVLHLDGAAWALRAALDAEADLSNLPVITRDSRTPMQSFRFTTGTDRPGCLSVPPPVLVVQGPEDFPVDITANGVDIRIQSTIFLRTLPGNVMQIIAGSGGAVLYPNTANKVFLSPAVSVLIPLGDDGFAADLYSQWRMLVGDEIDPYAALENVPSNIWNYPYVHPTLIVPSGIGVLPTPTVFPPGRPPVRPRPPFPRPPIVPRGLGVALTRVPWQPITIGDPTCPPWTFYHSNRDGGWDIFRLGSALDNNVSLGRGSSNIQPSASPDGEWVAFTSNRDQPGNWEIWISSADGSVQQRVTFNSADDVNPVWGPGALIAFESNRNDSWDLYLFDVSAGGEPVRLTDHPANDINPFWFPDGEHIAFQSDRDGNWEIYQLNINTGDLTRLTEEDTARPGGRDDQNPVISNDGTMVAWLQKNAFGVYDLWLMDLETGETRQLTDAGTDVAGHQFAPDDTFLAYHTSLDGEFDVFVVDIESGQIKNATNSPNTEDRAAAFWCESTAIVFHSDRIESAEYPGQRELFQVNPLPIDGPPTGATRLTSDPTSDNIYPLGSLREEINSREGRVPPRP